MWLRLHDKVDSEDNIMCMFDMIFMSCYKCIQVHISSIPLNLCIVSILRDIEGICLNRHHNKSLVCILDNLFLLCILHMSQYILYIFLLYLHNKIMHKSYKYQYSNIINNFIDISNNHHFPNNSQEHISYNYPNFNKKYIFINIYHMLTFDC